MNITLIGGSGFVGTRLLKLLSTDKRNRLRNIDLQQSYFYDQLTYIGDVRKQSDLINSLVDTDIVVLLAAVHRDDISPISEYYNTNVEGLRNTLIAMEKNGVKRIIFFSSVAVFGLNKENPNEEHAADPFNHYGKSKWQAEEILQEWYLKHPDWNIIIIRPTVIFGERNRGNVYNLLKQISSGRFLMIGEGNNRKSMAYVGNVVAFVKFVIDEHIEGYNVYNYVDKPDFTMNELVNQVEKILNKRIPSIHIPYGLGMLGGYCFDLFSFLLQRKMSVSSLRVKKFCATTEFDSNKMLKSGFIPPFTLREGLARTLEFEFKEQRVNDVVFSTE